MADRIVDYDTDAVSITSTVSSTKTASYNVEAVLAEHEEDDDQGRSRMEYLIKWEGYPLHRCMKSSFQRGAHCTWEPEEHLDGTTLLQGWARRRQQLGEIAFRNYMAKNEADFDAAQRTFETNQKRRNFLREKKRSKLKKRARPVAISDDSEEDLPLKLRKRRVKQRAESPREVLATREARNASQLNSLFTDSSLSASSSPATLLDTAQGELFVKQVPATRKAPLQQSESSSSDRGGVDYDVVILEESRLGEMRVTAEMAKTAKRRTDVINPLHEKRSTPRERVRSLKSPVKTGTRPKLKPAARPNEATGSRVKESRRPSQPEPVTLTSVSSPTLPKGPLTSSGIASIKRSEPKPKPTIGIKIVNEPKTPQRTPWTKGTKQFSTLRFRANADKRSRAEGTPDLGALDFVGNPPVGLAKASRLSLEDNPYGRRETGIRRVQEFNAEHTTKASASLEDWEAEKIPMVCPFWRLSSNCQNGDRKCKFMHRNQDPSGLDYPVADMYGYIPPKFQKPPITCPFWLTSKLGCKRSDAECKYTHRNTGWVHQGGIPIKINPTTSPIKRTRPPSELTCWYWSIGQCKHAADVCTFQHWDTGIVADPPGTLAGTSRAGDDKTSRNVMDSSIQYQQADFQAEQQSFAASALLLESTDEHILQSGAATSGIVIDPDAEHVDQPNDTANVVWYPSQTLVGNTADLLPSPPPPPPPPPLEVAPAKESCLPLKARIDSGYKLNFLDIFSKNDSQGGKSMMSRKAFLLFHPQQHLEELDIITRWLLMHHVEVGNAWFDGSWEHFKEQILHGESGVIITHPDFEFFTELSDLGQVLRNEVRLWSIGLQEETGHDPTLFCSPAALRHNCIEIFPHGGFIYITDEVFEQKPQLALEIVQLFLKKIPQLQQLAGPRSMWHESEYASLLWRLCVRPELMDYLNERCEAQAKEFELRDRDVISRAKLYTILSESNYIDQDDSSTALSLIADSFPILSERRSVVEGQPVNYFGTLERDQNEANLQMIRYYAGLHVDLRREYRQFFIVHTQPSAPYVRQWRDEIQTIAEVITPEACIEELGKNGKASMFDFCEQHMLG